MNTQTYLYKYPVRQKVSKLLLIGKFTKIGHVRRTQNTELAFLWCIEEYCKFGINRK